MLSSLKKKILRVFAAIALAVAWIVSFLFFFLALGPYAIVLRIAAGDLLERDPDPRQESYWHRLDPRRPRPGRPF